MLLTENAPKIDVRPQKHDVFAPRKNTAKTRRFHMVSDTKKAPRKHVCFERIFQIWRKGTMFFPPGGEKVLQMNVFLRVFLLSTRKHSAF